MKSNWWQSIRDRLARIKGFNTNWVQDALLVLIVLFVGISAFGLGRLSATEVDKPAIRLIQQKTIDETPMQLGGKIVASRKGSKYHYPWCSGAKTMKESNKIWFDSEAEARVSGYTPAKNCKGLK